MKLSTHLLKSATVLVSFAAHAAHAADGTWTSAGSANWDATGSWSGGIIADGTDSTASFTSDVAVTPLTVTLGVDRTIGALNFNDADLGSPGGYYVSANTLTLEVTSGQPTITVGSFASNHEVQITSQIAGTQGLVKEGDGTLHISNSSNGYTGGTLINGGTLRVGSGSSAGNSAGTITLQGTTTSTLRLDTNSNILNALVVADGSSIKTLSYVGISTAPIYAGGITINEATSGGFLVQSGPLTIADGGVLTISGQITGTGAAGITKTGRDTLVLSNSNDYTGPTTVTAGKLIINSTGAINSTSGVTIGTASTAAAAEFNYNSTTPLSKNIGFAGGSTGGTLSGTGTITNQVNINPGNTYTPGEKGAPGTQTLTGGALFAIGSIFQWDIDISGATEIGHDKVLDTAGLSGVNAVFDVVLGSGDSFADTFWDANKSWSDIFSVGSLSSVFSSITGPDIAWDSGTSRGNVTGQGYFTMSSNTLNWTAVPEPGNAMVGLLAVAGLLRRRRAGKC